MTAASASLGQTRDYSGEPKPHDSRTAEQRAHEPSMEEILASIRRIIAADTALPKARMPAQPLPVSKIAEAAAVPMVEQTAEAVPEARVALAEKLPQVLLPHQEPEEIAVHPHVEPLHAGPDAVAEMMAVVHPPLAIETAEFHHYPPHAGAMTETEAPVARTTVDVPAAVEEEEDENDIMDLAQHVAAAPDFRFLEQAALAIPAENPGLAAMETALQESYPAPAHGAYETLISPGTDAAVSASFHSLAQTIMLNNTALIEQMTREMLRPMLKNWLDDNLPVMVERLVRAEIERVARGGR